MGERLSTRMRAGIRLLLVLVYACIRAAAYSSYAYDDGSPVSEEELREWAVRLYKQQPKKPATSMDGEFKMSDSDGGRDGGPEQSSTSKAAEVRSPSAPPPPLAFLGVWKVLDLAARSNRMDKTVEAHMDITEGALLAAITQSFPRPSPIVCLAGFHTGHASIAWLDSDPGLRVLAFDEFTQSHQRGARAFIDSLYPRRLIPLAGDALAIAKDV